MLDMDLPMGSAIFHDFVRLSVRTCTARVEDGDKVPWVVKGFTGKSECRVVSSAKMTLERPVCDQERTRLPIEPGSVPCRSTLLTLG